MTIRLHSFDVFDTCLTRTFTAPLDVFPEVVRVVLRETGADVGDGGRVHALVEARLRAEREVRAQSPLEDISLPSVYAALTRDALFGVEPEVMMAAELDVERRCMRGVAKMRECIAALRRGGARIAFISDMYLPGAAIKDMLREHGMAEEHDPVYVSGDVGLTKASGGLFKHVCEREGVTPREVSHVGDNEHADLTAPRRQGIATSLSKHACLNRREQGLAKAAQGGGAAALRLAGLARAVRVMDAARTPAEETVTAVAADVAGPLLTSYVAWVLADAVTRGIERLYFVSRDGQILLKVANRLLQGRSGPECRYLYGSRQAWFLPSVLDAQPPELDWLVIPGHSRSPRDLLRRLTILPEEIAGSLERHGVSPSDWDRQLGGDDLAAFRNALGEPACAALIRAKAAAARELCLAYFGQEGLLDSDKWALVDMGWTLKCQRAVGRILRSAGWKSEVRGYYLEVLDGHPPRNETGLFLAFTATLSPRQRRVVRRVLSGHIDLVEQVFCAGNHGRVESYRGEGDRVVPVLAADRGAQDVQDRVKIMQGAVEAFAAEAVKAGIGWEAMACTGAPAFATLTEFVRWPSREEAEALANTPIGDDQNEARVSRLARRLTWRDLAVPWKEAKGAGYAEIGFYWRAGSLAMSPVWLRSILRPTCLCARASCAVLRTMVRRLLFVSAA